MLPQTNATLTQLAGGGGSEDFDQVAGVDPARWSGSVDAYYQERRDRVYGDNITSVVLRRSLIVANSALPLDVEEGDTVTFRFRGQLRSGRVQLIERRDLVAAGDVATTRLTLEEV